MPCVCVHTCYLHVGPHTHTRSYKHTNCTRILRTAAADENKMRLGSIDVYKSKENSHPGACGPPFATLSEGFVDVHTVFVRYFFRVFRTRDNWPRYTCVYIYIRRRGSKFMWRIWLPNVSVSLGGNLFRRNSLGGNGRRRNNVPYYRQYRRVYIYILPNHAQPRVRHFSNGFARRIVESRKFG